MRLLVAILAVLALVGSAMAWELSDNLQYSYTKAAWQEAGSNLILDPFTGATSQASFFDPGSTTNPIPKSGAEVRNELKTVTLDQTVRYPDADLTYNDVSMVLTQGGSASVKLHSPISDAAAALAYQQFGKLDTPEIMGTSSAYQNLNVAGGFGKVDAGFDSQAAVGADNLWAVTATKSATASVDSDKLGGGTIESANMGVSVESDILKSYDGTGWDTPEYSGGITMWANFVACDPGCSNPIVTTVNGQIATSAFPGNGPSGASWGGDQYWGGSGGSSITTITNPFNSNMPDLTPVYTP
jgi:hypothetical protein